MGAATRGIERLEGALKPFKASPDATPLDPEGTRTRFVEAMENDFGTPQALASLFDLARAITALIERRTIARTEKDFILSDEIRDKLATLHILLEDTPEGTHWSMQS